LLGEDAALVGWLNERGIPFSQTSGQESGTAGEIVLVVSSPHGSAPSAMFDQLSQRADDGSTVIFLTPEFFRAPDGKGWLSAGELATIAGLRHAGEPIDAWGTAHPILDNLEGCGLLDDRIFRELLPLVAFVDLDAGGQIVAAAHLSRIHPDEYRSGVLLSVHAHGTGRIVLSAFRILENLGLDAAAERLFMNLLHAAAATESTTLDTSSNTSRSI